MFSRDTGGQTEPREIATHADPDGLDAGVGIDAFVDLGEVHVALMDGCGGDVVVIIDDGIEHVTELNVRVPITGVYAAMLVLELNGTGDGFGESELRGSRTYLVQLLPGGLCEVFSNQTVLRLDFWKGPKKRVEEK